MTTVALVGLGLSTSVLGHPNSVERRLGVWMVRGKRAEVLIWRSQMSPVSPTGAQADRGGGNTSARRLGNICGAGAWGGPSSGRY